MKAFAAAFLLLVACSLSASTQQAMFTFGAGPTDPYGDAVSADSPYRWFKLGEASGTTMTDSSSNAANGTYTGSVVLGNAGIVPGTGKSADFTSNTSYGSSGVLVATTDLTLEIVFKTSDTSIHGDSMMEYNAQSDGNNGARDRGLYLNGSGFLYGYCYFLSGSGATTIHGNTNLRDGAVHVAQLVVNNTAKTFKLYVDGSEVASTSFTGTLYDYSGVGGPYLLVAHGSFPDGTVVHFPGFLQHAVIYHSALSTTRITAHNTAAR